MGTNSLHHHSASSLFSNISVVTLIRDFLRPIVDYAVLVKTFLVFRWFARAVQRFGSSFRVIYSVLVCLGMCEMCFLCLSYIFLYRVFFKYRYTLSELHCECSSDICGGSDSLVQLGSYRKK